MSNNPPAAYGTTGCILPVKLYIALKHFMQKVRVGIDVIQPHSLCRAIVYSHDFVQIITFV